MIMSGRGELLYHHSVTGYLIHSPKAVIDDGVRMECRSSISNSPAHIPSCVCEPHRTATHGSPLVPRLRCGDTLRGSRCVPWRKRVGGRIRQRSNKLVT